MYKDYFHFERYPFQNTPDLDFYYDSVNHREALATMMYGIREGKGFVMMAGDVGTGKTMLIQELKRELGDEHLVIEIANPWAPPEDVFRVIRTKLEVRTDDPEELALLDQFKQRLMAIDNDGRRVVLIIDEAHLMPERTLEGIRLLSNIETNARKLIQVILVGQQELVAVLNRHSMRQIQQRIALSFHLQPLNARETEEYIRHRLRVSAGNTDLFSREAVALIFKESQGSPRVINQLCDNSLLIAFGRSKPMVDLAIVREVIANLNPARLNESFAKPAQGQKAAAKPATAAPGGAFATPPAGNEAPREPSIAAEPVNVQPSRMPAATTESVPFELPRPEPVISSAQEFRPVRNSRPSGSGSGLSSVLIAAVVGLGIGGGAIYFMSSQKDKSADTAKSESRPAQPEARVEPPKPAPAPTQPGANVSAPQSAAPVPAMMPEPARASGKGDSLFPYEGAAIRSAKDLPVSATEGTAAIASRFYGAWNDTVRDILYSANPLIRDLDKVVPGTSLKFPVVSRVGMVVADKQGGYSIFYASFEDERGARETLDSLKKVWKGAYLLSSERQNGQVFRIYVGGYQQRAEAENVAGSLWFKHLPTIN